MTMTLKLNHDGHGLKLSQLIASPFSSCPRGGDAHMDTGLGAASNELDIPVHRKQKTAKIQMKAKTAQWVIVIESSLDLLHVMVMDDG